MAIESCLSIVEPSQGTLVQCEISPGFGLHFFFTCILGFEKVWILNWIDVLSVLFVLRYSSNL